MIRIALSSLLVIWLAPITNVHAKAEGNFSKRVVRYESFSHQDLSVDEGFWEAVSPLDYLPGELPYVFSMDLNADGLPELFVGSPNYRLCGTAGCPYILLDGKTKELIGDFFGTVAITSTTVNSYPVIHAISKRDIDTTLLQIYVFNGDEYTLVGHALLNSEGMDDWAKDVRWR